MKFCSWQLFNLKSSCQLKTKFEVLKFEFQISWTTSDGETIKMKVVGLKKLWNFIVDNILIWIRLGLQTNNLRSV